jgi:hypothetical protein
MAKQQQKEQPQSTEDILKEKLKQYQDELEKINVDIERLTQIKLRIEGGIIAAQEILDALTTVV